MKTRFHMLALICIIFSVAASLFADNLLDFEAAKQGNAEAQYRLAYSYFEGNGVEKDYVEAYKWFRKAAEQGNADAQSMVGYCYFCGIGVEKNLVEAYKWFRKAAEQGHAVAQHNLGFYYEEGKAVDLD